MSQLSENSNRSDSGKAKKPTNKWVVIFIIALVLVTAVKIFIAVSNKSEKGEVKAEVPLTTTPSVTADSSVKAEDVSGVFTLTPKENEERD